MNRESLFARLRGIAAPAWRGLVMWALVLALSALSFYVHLWRVSVFRGEAALVLGDARVLASQPSTASSRRR